MNGQTVPVTRGVVIIVLSGALLGIGYNYLGLLSRPARGLAWISEPKVLPTIEDQLGSAAAAPSAPAATAQASAPKPEPPPPTVAHPAPAVTPPAATTKREPAERTPASGGEARAGSVVADPDDPLGIAVPAESAGGLPDIPDLDRPFAVQLATVKRFVDANAAYIVDARDVEEFEEGHIPGAVNLPFSTAGTDPARLEAIDAGGRPIIVYCGGGTCEVSMSLAETLVYQFAKRKVLVYMGGFPEWQSAGYPVQKGKGDEVKG